MFAGSVSYIWIRNTGKTLCPIHALVLVIHFRNSKKHLGIAHDKKWLNPYPGLRYWLEICRHQYRCSSYFRNLLSRRTKNCDMIFRVTLNKGLKFTLGGWSLCTLLSKDFAHSLFRWQNLTTWIHTCHLGMKKYTVISYWQLIYIERPQHMTWIRLDQLSMLAFTKHWLQRDTGNQKSGLLCLYLLLDANVSRLRLSIPMFNWRKRKQDNVCVAENVQLKIFEG